MAAKPDRYLNGAKEGRSDISTRPPPPRRQSFRFSMTSAAPSRFNTTFCDDESEDCWTLAS